MSSRIASLTSVAVLAACTAEPLPPEGEQVTSFVERREIPIAINMKIDILFVVDNSPVMAAAQAKLVADYRAMIDVLGQSSIGVPDIHIGVATADLRDQGRLRNAAFLADAPRFAWQRERNYDGALVENFLPLADVGVAGSPDTRPLEAMQRALSEHVNPGFVREHAYLAVVFLTAGDDRGSTAVADVARALKSLKNDPSKVIVTGAFGACASAGIVATEAPRLASFFDQFPNRSSQARLCDPDLGPLLALANQMLKYSLGLACMGRVREPHECNAWLVDPETAEEARFTECAAADSSRCWRLAPHAGCFGGELAFQPRPWAIPFPATLIVECVAE